MLQCEGQIRVEYSGEVSRDLCERLETIPGLRVVGGRPLTLVSREPETVLNQIMRYLGDEGMRVNRVEFRGARA